MASKEILGPQFTFTGQPAPQSLKSDFLSPTFLKGRENEERQYLCSIYLSLSNSVFALTGSGLETDPYLIQSLADFNEFASDPNYWDDYTRLETDVNLEGITYNTAVIAPDTVYTTYNFDGVPYTGEFDGNSYKILNLTIDTGGLDKDFLGLFGMISASAVVANLGIEDAVVTGSGNFVYGDFTGDFGVLVGNNSGVIQNCWVKGSLTAGNYSEDVGGLCGWNQSTGTISGCYVIGPVSGGANSGGLGGVCGSNDGIITDCWANSSITGRNSLGGLCGFLDGGSIINSYSTGSVTGTAGDLGGFCGGAFRFC
jgi:hypothetical protein